MKARLFLLFFFTLFAPSFVSANVMINEIMYDIDGTDTGREWIEIFNNSNVSVDLNKWRLFEGDTNHEINLVNENDSSIIPANGYIIIADNSIKFLSDNPNFSGTVFDSSFSLKNTGEIIILRNSELIDIDQVDYLPDWGANGDGNSLQKINGQWIASYPTIGAQNSNLAVQPPNESSSDVVTQNVTQATASVVNWPTEQQIFANAGADRTVVAGADTLFEGKALGLKKEPLDNARYTWTFGDGSSKEGQKVSHLFKYPGEYIVYLNVSSGYFSAPDQVMAKVIKNEMKTIEANNNYIKIKNDSNITINLSGWFLKYDNIVFAFPENSFIKASGELSIPSSITKIDSIQTDKIVLLLYPNNVVAYSFYIWPEGARKQTQIQAQPQESVSVPAPVINDNLEIESPSEINQEAGVAGSLEDNGNNYWSLKNWIILILGIGVVSGIGFVYLKNNPEK